MGKGLNQFVIFSAIGAVGTVGHYATLILLVEVLSQPPILASSLGFVVGALINYILNYHFTFKSNKPHREALLQFLLVAAVGAGINAGLMYLCIEFLQLHYFIAQLLATGIVLLWNFIINKYWTFNISLK